jgi:hypothetical protein
MKYGIQCNYTCGFYACICRIRRLSIAKLYNQYPPTWVSAVRFGVLLNCKRFLIILVDYFYAMMLLDIWNLKIFCEDNTSYWCWMGFSFKKNILLNIHLCCQDSLSVVVINGLMAGCPVFNLKSGLFISVST